jgi:hypothetical protein
MTEIYTCRNDETVLEILPQEMTGTVGNVYICPYCELMYTVIQPGSGTDDTVLVSWGMQEGIN